VFIVEDAQILFMLHYNFVNFISFSDIGDVQKKQARSYELATSIH
jgi:hypothetical protein